eukprot:CFRG4722T1
MAKQREIKNKASRSMSTSTPRLTTFRTMEEMQLAQQHQQRVHKTQFVCGVPGARSGFSRSNNHQGWGPKKANEKDEEKFNENSEDSDLQNLKWLSHMNFTFPQADDDHPTYQQIQPLQRFASNPQSRHHSLSDVGKLNSSINDQFVLPRDVRLGNGVNGRSFNGELSWQPHASSQSLQSLTQQQSALNMAVGVDPLSNHGASLLSVNAGSTDFSKVLPSPVAIDPSMTLRKSSAPLFIQRQRSPSTTVGVSPISTVKYINSNPSSTKTMCTGRANSNDVKESDSVHTGVDFSKNDSSLQTIKADGGTLNGLFPSASLHTSERQGTDADGECLRISDIIVLGLFSAPHWRLTVGEIYEFIKKHYPAHTITKKDTTKKGPKEKAGAPTWKLSVRQALTLNPGFVKDKKEGEGNKTRWTFKSEAHAIEFLRSVRAKILEKKTQEHKEMEEQKTMEGTHDRTRGYHTSDSGVCRREMSIPVPIGKRTLTRPSTKCSLSLNPNIVFDSDILSDPMSSYLSTTFPMELPSAYGVTDDAGSMGGVPQFTDQAGISNNYATDILGDLELEAPGLFSDIDHMDISCIPNNIKQASPQTQTPLFEQDWSLLDRSLSAPSETNGIGRRSSLCAGGGGKNKPNVGSGLFHATVFNRSPSQSDLGVGVDMGVDVGGLTDSLSGLSGFDNQHLSTQHVHTHRNSCRGLSGIDDHTYFGVPEDNQGQHRDGVRSGSRENILDPTLTHTHTHTHTSSNNLLSSASAPLLAHDHASKNSNNNGDVGPFAYVDVTSRKESHNVLELRDIDHQHVNIDSGVDPFDDLQDPQQLDHSLSVHSPMSSYDARAFELMDLDNWKPPANLSLL